MSRFEAAFTRLSRGLLALGGDSLPRMMSGLALLHSYLMINDSILTGCKQGNLSKGNISAFRANTFQISD
jgi:hypothetical protein